MLGGILLEIIGSVLCFVLFFGIGFILNMLVKTTWMPLWLFLIVVLPLGIWYLWQPNLSLADNLKSFVLSDLLLLAAGAVGAFVSGWAIRALRRNGYKMF
jgi:uncharacterized membrane protein